MSEPRFYVRELVGIPIPLVGKRASDRAKASYYIMDRLYNCAVVATFENVKGVSALPRVTLYRRATVRCAFLNAWWRQELQRG